MLGVRGRDLEVEITEEGILIFLERGRGIEREMKGGEVDRVRRMVVVSLVDLQHPVSIGPALILDLTLPQDGS